MAGNPTLSAIAIGVRVGDVGVKQLYRPLHAAVALSPLLHWLHRGEP